MPLLKVRPPYASTTSDPDKTIAILKDGDILDHIPLESPTLITFVDPRTDKEFRGYLIDVDALTADELHAIYQDMKTRFLPVPCFDSWVEIVKMEGMPIREERVSAVAFDLRLVV